MAHEVPPTPRCHLPWKSLNLRPELSVAMDSLPIHAQLASEMTTMDYLPFPAQQYDGYAEYLQELEAGSHGEQAEEMARLRDRLNQMAQRHAVRAAWEVQVTWAAWEVQVTWAAWVARKVWAAC